MVPRRQMASATHFTAAPHGSRTSLVRALWVVGPSDRGFAKDRSLQAPWSVVYAADTFGCSGGFTHASDLIMTVDGLVAPTCS